MCVCERERAIEKERERVSDKHVTGLQVRMKQKQQSKKKKIQKRFQCEKNKKQIDQLN